MSRRVALTFTLALAALAQPGAPVRAGSHQADGHEIYIEDLGPGRGFGGGSFMAVRGSADHVQYLGCDLYGASMVWCVVVDANGRGGACSTNNPGLIANARAIDRNSLLFVGWTPEGTCSQIYVSSMSYYGPTPGSEVRW